MAFCDIPSIDTARLRLTALSERHFDDYASMLADADSTRWIGDGQPLDRMNAWRSMAMLLGHWALRGCGMWAIELRDTGQFIGRAGLMKPEGWPDLELGWMLKPEHRHHGYATEAGAAILDFAWNRMHAQRVISLVRIGNEASDHVAERLGGEHIDNIDFLGGATHLFAYYPPHREVRRAS
ncbi:GNAT family N-acetyltransferase [Luteibacter sp. PPL201]|uniref:GNAT family N-acetyltransferase n=1 Tax=Luteibacter sahnii TaxID=3021977 RepID=A0ABT6BBD1_9GAMM|nr:GNAT family N-acetyltransferase [Luteibacter sp. PPL193]MDY1547406.1 GNAT family N-acetyltransferase [Luteibacter sp. PPL193]